MNKTEKLSKHHLVQSLFGLGSEDLHIVEQTVVAIDFAITGKLEEPASLEEFKEKASILAEETPRLTPGSGFYHIDLRSTTYDALWVHAAVRKAMKQLAGYKYAVLLVTGLRDSITRDRQYWTRRLRREHKEAMETIDSIATRWNTPSTRLNIIYL